MEPRPSTDFSFLPDSMSVLSHVLQSRSRRVMGGFDFKGAIQFACLGAIVASLASPANGAIISFSPDKSALTTNPIVGMSQTTNDYMLTTAGGLYSLDENFSGNNQEAAIGSNPGTMTDAASFGDNYTLQLRDNDAIYKIDNSTGSDVNFGSQSILSAPSNTFGLGAIFQDNKAYSFALNGSNEVVQSVWDLNANSVVETVNFGVMPSQYGIVTGAESYKLPNGVTGHFLTTKDAPSSGENYFLDYNPDGTFTGNGGTISGSAGDLEDITYSNGEVALGFNFANIEGEVQTGTYTGTAVPEPATYAAFLGALALGATAYKRRRKG